MRATSFPPALPIATAAVLLMAAVLVPPAVPSAALAERWLRPVPGEVARSFSYNRATPFRAGEHRGMVLTARPGTVVRAACGGQVIHAGPVAGPDRVISVRCGRRRVSYLPLSTVAVGAGARVLPGDRLGTVAAGDGGLHFGVRAEADRFGYEDPLPLLTSGRWRPPLPLGRPPASPRPESAPLWHRVHPGPLGRPSMSPVRRPAPAGVPVRRPAPVARPPAVLVPPEPSIAALRPQTAHWTVWAGLALVLAGAAGSGGIVLRRRRLGQRSLRAAGSAA